jgi:tubulin-specific chaperone A
MSRLVKECAYYKKEVEENETTLQQMKDDDRDPYDVKKFAEVLDESYMMVPDSELRLTQAKQDLRAFLDSSSDTSLNPTGEWYTVALSILKEQESLVANAVGDNDVPVGTSVVGLADDEAF